MDDIKKDRVNLSKVTTIQFHITQTTSFFNFFARLHSAVVQCV